MHKQGFMIGDHARKATGHEPARPQAGHGLELLLVALSVACLTFALVIVIGPRPIFAIQSVLHGMIFTGLAALVASRREAEALLRQMAGPVRGKPLSALAAPKWRWAKSIHEAVSVWSAAHWDEMRQLRSRAQNDGMTRLPNRWYFRRLVEARLSRLGEGEAPGAMFFLDVDGFKRINDSLGHEAGDQTLMHLSRRLILAAQSSEIACRDTVMGRLGGDEFTIFVPGITSGDQALRFGERLQRVLEEPIEIDAGTTLARCSIGVVIGKPADTFATMLSCADVAMYAAKMAGKNQVGLYTDEMARESRINKVIESDIRATLSNGSLTMAYQPQFECATRKIVAAEALLRWNHPVLGDISPSRFVPTAERLGLIGLFGDWAMNEAVGYIARLAAQGTPLKVAVNVSPIQLRSEDFARTVKAILRRHAVPAHLLELEITESIAMVDCEESSRTLADLRAAGIAIAIDDFGMGYSNLSRLVRLPIDQVKIDKSMIHHVVDHLETQILVKTVIDMAAALGVGVLAEGIETEDQRDLLATLGCELGQGFLVARPMSADQLASELVAHGGAQACQPLRAVGC